MTEEGLEKRGAAFFDKLHPDDKAALKWFLTGQIQNILANEHGVGGSKGVRDAVQEKANERINTLLNDELFLEKLAERLAAARKINFAKVITETTQKVAEAEIEKVAGYAARRVKVQVYIEPEPEPGGPADGYGKF